MVDFKISDLPLANPMTGTELMEVVQGGVSKKAVMAFLAATSAASRNVATSAQAIAGTAGVLPDAAGVHSAIRGLAVGTVSQSGGVPTGAIIQRGSNANGEFVRYADGTQICWTTPRPTGARNVAEGNVFASLLLGPHNWPIEFPIPPAVFGSTPSSEAGWMGTLGTTSLIYAKSFCPISIALSTEYVVTGLGRWY